MASENLTDLQQLAMRNCDCARLPLLPGEEKACLLQPLTGLGWSIVQVDGRDDAADSLQKVFALPDFLSSLQLANKIGAVAEEMGHHPDLLVSWGALRVQIFTHSQKGLTLADFVLAARIELLFSVGDSLSSNPRKP